MKNKIFKMQFSKIFLFETFIFGMQHHLEALYQSCSNDAHGVKIDSAPGTQFNIELYKENVQRLPLLKGILTNSTGMVPGWSPTNIVEIVLIGCKVGHGVTKKVFKIQLSKNVLSETKRPRPCIFGI